MRRLLTSGLFCVCLTPSLGQTMQPDTISGKLRMVSKVFADSICLRWAPVDYEAWREGNLAGYEVVKVVLMRNDVYIQDSPKIVLTKNPIKPMAEADWEPLVKTDHYSAIAAQALFGEGFEVDLNNPSAMTVVNKVKGNEQRFSFAMLSADMSLSAARALGLYFCDALIKSNERYLYHVQAKTHDKDIHATIFAAPSERETLAKPEELQAQVNGNEVSLKWLKSPGRIYSGYVIQRSQDSVNFFPISQTPYVSLSPKEYEASRYEYAVDQMPDSIATMYYRVVGLTLFGERSEPSDIISVHRELSFSSMPRITNAEIILQDEVRVFWEISKPDIEAASHFELERAPRASGPYDRVDSTAKKTVMFLEDRNPSLVNYYRVRVIGRQNQFVTSSPYLLTLVDSVPPSAPVNVSAAVDEFGNVKLKWDRNKETDISGYRVYRATNSRQEPAQLTSAPMTDSTFNDRVDLKHLNNSVYYTVMAVDRNQNQSKLSSLFRLRLPDKVPPQPPVMLPIELRNDTVKVSWVQSPSRDVKSYEVYRKTLDSKDWIRLKIVSRNPLVESQVYHDPTGANGVKYLYTVTAVDSAGLESRPAEVVMYSLPIKRNIDALVLNEAKIDVEHSLVTISWKKPSGAVLKYSIYKSIDNSQFEIVKVLASETTSYMDSLHKGSVSYYQVVAVYADGQKSKFGKGVKVQF